jgi:hypothetical protein
VDPQVVIAIQMKGAGPKQGQLESMNNHLN